MMGPRGGLTAMQRAARAWGGAALDSRHMLREQGVRGALPVHDDFASQRRGVSVAKGVASLALELQSARVPDRDVRVRVLASVARVLDEVLPPAA